MNVVPFRHPDRPRVAASTPLDRIAAIMAEAVDREGRTLGVEEGRQIARELAGRIHAHRISTGLEPDE